MTLTKDKNKTHKQRTLPNDEHPFKGSNGHYETDINGCQKWHSFLFNTYNRLYVARMWQDLKVPVTRVPHKPMYKERMPFFAIRWNAFHVRFILWMDVHHPVMCVVVCTCYFSPLSTSFASDALKVIPHTYPAGKFRRRNILTFFPTFFNAFRRPSKYRRRIDVESTSKLQRL